MPQAQTAHRRGFTLVELMTTLTIIVILISITIPVVSRVRKAASRASVEAELASISSAIQQYHQTHNAFPGPLSDSQLYHLNLAGGGGAPSGIDHVDSSNVIIIADMVNVTSTENLVLGLLGGLRPDPNNPGQFAFDAGLVGKGPRGLNPANPKGYSSLLDGIPLTQNYAKTPDWGHYKDSAGVAADSNIPEILDKFSNPMPILYFRAKIGANGVISIGEKPAGPGAIVYEDSAGNPVHTSGAPTQFDLNHALPYTRGMTGSIGEGKSIRFKDYTTAPGNPTVLPHGLQEVRETATIEKGTGYEYPYNAFPYFVNRAIAPNDPTRKNATGTPKQKDAYILISAGYDRVYGTADDVTNFGLVTDQ